MSPVVVAAIVMALVCVLLFHGYEIFNFTLSIDEEHKLYFNNPATDVVQGRWGRALYYWLILPDTTIPVTPIAVGLILYATAFVLLVKHFQLRQWQSAVVAAPLFFGFPTLIYDIAFNFLMFEIGLGSLATVLALRVATKIDVPRFIAAAALIAYATSLYQAFVYFAVILFAADLILRGWLRGEGFDRDWLRRAVCYSGIILLGLLIYVVITIGFLWWFQFQSIASGYYRPDLLFHDVATAVGTALIEMLDVYVGSAQIFLNHHLYYRLLLVACAGVLAWNLGAWRQSWRGVLVVLGLLGLMMVAPFVQNPLAGGLLPYRAFIGVPLALAIVVLFSTEIAPPWLRSWILLPLAALLIIEFSGISNQQYYAGHWQLERDKALGAQLIYRVEQEFPSDQPYTLVPVGAVSVKHDQLNRAVMSSTLGELFFSWDEGNPTRIALFLNFLSNATFLVPTAEQSEMATEAAQAMPAWPAADSLRRIGNVIVVKFSDPGAQQIKLLCANRTSDFCDKHGSP